MGSRARYTMPNAPRPNSSSSSYLPSFLRSHPRSARTRKADRNSREEHEKMGWGPCPTSTPPRGILGHRNANHDEWGDNGGRPTPESVRSALNTPRSRRGCQLGFPPQDSPSVQWGGLGYLAMMVKGLRRSLSPKDVIDVVAVGAVLAQGLFIEQPLDAATKTNSV